MLINCWETRIFIGLYLIATANGILSKPNVLLIIVDDLRPAIKCYGDQNAFTPHIDNLAKKSIIFTNTFAQQALCAPSRNSLLTSRRPDSLHLYDFYSYWRNVAGNFTSMPQFFRSQGYHTVSVGKIFHPGISSNMSDDQPFSWSEDPFHPSSEKYKESHVCLNEDGTLGRNLVCPVLVEFQPEGTLPDLQSVQEAKNILIQTKPNPLFLAIGFHKPHVPIKFPRKYLDFHPIEQIALPAYRWKPGGLPNVAWNPWTDIREREDIQKLNLTFPFEQMHDSEIRSIRQSYYAAVTYIDDLIGQLLKVLEDSKKVNNTIILIIGDHGWSMAEHGEWSKYSNYDIALRVPMILHVPNVTEDGYITDKLTELVDIFPTLASLAGLPDIPTCGEHSAHEILCTEGVSLQPLIENIVTQSAEAFHWKQGAFSQYPRPSSFPTLYPNSDKPRLKDIKIMGYSLRTQQYRYTEWVHFDTKNFKPIWPSLIAAELYDHILDPDENNNLFRRHEMIGIEKKLQQQLHAGWRYSLPKRQVKLNLENDEQKPTEFLSVIEETQLLLHK